VTVSDELEKQNLINAVGGMSYISSLSNIVPSAASANHYIDIVRRDSVLRQVILACGKTIEKAYDKNSDESIIGQAEKAIYEIAEKGQSGALERLEVSVEKVINRFEDIHKDSSVLRGLKTGFYQLDKAINGLQKTDLIILAARPGVGKTSLAMNIVSNAAINHGAKCAVFSLEMGREQLAQRMLCSVANVSMAKALRGDLDEHDWIKIWKADKKLKNADIFVDDNAMNTPSQVLSKCRKLKREKGGLDLVVIDYLGLMKSDSKSDNRQNEVADISRQLKILAKEIEAPVLSLCQLNRSVESRDTKDGKPAKPMLSDLRDSGSIEQDADMVWFIHRDMSAKEISEDKTGNYTAELIIAKFRNGQPGSVFLGWDGSRTSFVNLEKDANEQSLVGQYEAIEDARAAKKTENSIEEYNAAIEKIRNEMDATDFSSLTPPPEDAGDYGAPVFDEMPDFSNVSIPTDDELF
jgi:replicative DNA helicase